MVLARISRTVVKANRQPRPGDSRAYLVWIKTLPCMICGVGSVDPHHLMRINDGAPKGMGRTNEDRWALPCCRKHHDEIHDKGAADDEAYLMEKFGISGRDLAKTLWGLRDREDRDDRALRILARQR